MMSVYDTGLNEQVAHAGAEKPFNLNAYTTLNLQAGYAYKNVGVRVFANNLNNALGYNAYYRGGYINRNDPRNFAVQVNYKF